MTTGRINQVTILKPSRRGPRARAPSGRCPRPEARGGRCCPFGGWLRRRRGRRGCRLTAGEAAPIQWSARSSHGEAGIRLPRLNSSGCFPQWRRWRLPVYWEAQRSIASAPKAWGAGRPSRGNQRSRGYARPQVHNLMVREKNKVFFSSLNRGEAPTIHRLHRCRPNQSAGLSSPRATPRRSRGGGRARPQSRTGPEGGAAALGRTLNPPGQYRFGNTAASTRRPRAGGRLSYVIGGFSDPPRPQTTNRGSDGWGGGWGTGVRLATSRWTEAVPERVGGAGRQGVAPCGRVRGLAAGRRPRTPIEGTRPVARTVRGTANPRRPFGRPARQTSHFPRLALSCSHSYIHRAAVARADAANVAAPAPGGRRNAPLPTASNRRAGAGGPRRRPALP